MSHSVHGHQHFLSHIPVEPLAAVVLSAAGALTSWAGYQGSLWDGVQLVHYGEAGEHRVEATHAALDASMVRAVEVGLFRAWAEAMSKGDENLARFYEARFPFDLRTAFQQWRALQPVERSKAPPTPFALESYRPAGFTKAKLLEAQADKAFQAAIKAKHQADAYMRAAVVLASAMFFAGIGQAFDRPAVRALLLTMSIAALALGIVQMVRLPVLALGELH